MNCQHCDYPLWNLHSRTCPECGEGFLPSDFRFSKKSVRFSCPHCAQEYYGTGADGHLEPRQFDCVGCGERVEMNEMVLLPAEGVSERQTRADVNPWLETHKRFLLRWVRTMFRGPSSPAWMMRSTPVDSPPAQAWFFAGITHLIFGLVFFAPLLLFGAMGGMGVVGVMGGIFFGTAIAFVLLLGLWVLTAHGVLRLGGKTEGGIGRTAHALCYTCSPNVVVLFPCLGIYFGWIGTLWWVIAAGIALATAQKVRGVRAALAVGVLPGVIAVLVVGVAVSGIIGAYQSSVTFSQTASGSAYDVGIFRAPLRVAAAAGAWPVHMGELLDDGSLSPQDFVAAMSITTTQDVGLGGVALSAWWSLAPESRESTLAAVLESMPTDVVAHQLGDFVFTYHGIDPVNPPPGLWIVIEAWDQKAAVQQPQRFVAVLTTGGSSRLFPRRIFAAQLQAQNQLRVSLGLPVLPDPFTVRSGSPAVAPPGGLFEPGSEPGTPGNVGGDRPKSDE